MLVKTIIVPCLGVLLGLLGATAYVLYPLLMLAAAAERGEPAGFASALLGQQLVLGLVVGGLLLFFRRRIPGAWWPVPAGKPAPLAPALADCPRAASVLDALEEGLVLLDENHWVLLANPAGSRLLGLPVAALAGQPFGQLARKSAVAAKLLPYLEGPGAQRPQPLPILTLPQRGSEVPYQLLLTEVPLPSGAGSETAATGTLVTLRDVSDYQQLDQVKWRFLTTVSQELHTPLSRMQVSLLRLQDGKAGPLTPEQHNIAYTLARDNKHLLKVVHDLHDVSQLETGTIQLNFQAAPLHDIVQFVVATIRPQLQPKRLVLEVQVPADLPPVRADIEKTTWVLLSLLANAIRYAHMQDTLRIRASLLPTGQHLQVSVQDQGPGIAPEMRERIFQRFSQVPTQGGSGLGLPIARQIATAHGGDLTVTSEPGAGTTFVVGLPA